MARLAEMKYTFEPITDSFSSSSLGITFFPFRRFSNCDKPDAADSSDLHDCPSLPDEPRFHCLID
jgi:hypothetical protein